MACVLYDTGRRRCFFHACSSMGLGPTSIGHRSACASTPQVLRACRGVSYTCMSGPSRNTPHNPASPLGHVGRTEGTVGAPHIGHGDPTGSTGLCQLLIKKRSCSSNTPPGTFFGFEKLEKNPTGFCLFISVTRSCPRYVDTSVHDARTIGDWN